MHKPAVGRSLLAATLLALTPPHAPAQTNVVPAAAPTLAFDIVSVKRTKTISDKETIESPTDSDGITIQNLTMLGIIEFAYNFRRSELISGLPQWAKTQRYDLLAKVADPDVAAFHKLNQEQRRLMLQALLANEFQPKAHREQKEVPIYALLVGKNGLKMKQAMPGDKYPNGMKLQDGTPAGAGVLMGPTGQGVPMSALVLMLSRLGLDRQLVDKNGTNRHVRLLTSVRAGARFGPSDQRPASSGIGGRCSTALDLYSGARAIGAETGADPRTG